MLFPISPSFVGQGGSHLLGPSDRQCLLQTLSSTPPPARARLCQACIVLAPSLRGILPLPPCPHRCPFLTSPIPTFVSASVSEGPGLQCQLPQRAKERNALLRSRLLPLQALCRSQPTYATLPGSGLLGRTQTQMPVLCPGPVLIAVKSGSCSGVHWRPQVGPAGD